MMVVVPSSQEALVEETAGVFRGNDIRLKLLAKHKVGQEERGYTLWFFETVESGPGTR